MAADKWQDKRKQNTGPCGNWCGVRFPFVQQRSRVVTNSYLVCDSCCDSRCRGLIAALLLFSAVLLSKCGPAYYISCGKMRWQATTGLPHSLYTFSKALVNCTKYIITTKVSNPPSMCMPIHFFVSVERSWLWLRVYHPTLARSLCLQTCIENGRNFSSLSGSLLRY